MARMAGSARIRALGAETLLFQLTAGVGDRGHDPLVVEMEISVLFVAFPSHHDSNPLATRHLAPTTNTHAINNWAAARHARSILAFRPDH